MPIVKVEREELDEAAFGAVQDVMAEVKGWTTRQRLTVTLNVTNALMARFDKIVIDDAKSDSASKAAKKRWAKVKKAAPALPPPGGSVPPSQADVSIQPAPFGASAPTQETERI